LEAVIPEVPFNVMQVGFLINGEQTDPAQVVFSGLVATINETPASQWSGRPVVPVDGGRSAVDTGSWLGWLMLFESDWHWSYSLNGWVYLPESQSGPGGGWIYRPR
jgi:hypothetical protein